MTESHTIPPGIQARIARLNALADSLAEAGHDLTVLGKISRAVTGLSRREHLHCTGSRELDELINVLERMANEANL